MASSTTEVCYYASMRFSIRTLLAVITLAALVMLAFQTRRSSMASAARLSQLESEVDSLITVLQPDNPEAQAYQNATSDLHASLRENRDRCEEALLGLIDKYAAIEVRDPAFVSLRSYPTLKDGPRENHLAFRIVISEERSVWLKLGFHLGHLDSLYDSLEGIESKLLSEAPFNWTGPLEIQIPPGTHIIQMDSNEPQDGQVMIRMLLNDQVLAQLKNVPTVIAKAIGNMSISARKQIDYQLNRPLPNLMTLRIDVQETPKSTDTEYSLSCWLSDRSSSFRSMKSDD